MQVPVGYIVENGVLVPDDWTKIIFNSVVWVRFPHMLLGAYLAGAFCVAATGAWYLLRKSYHAEARVMLRMGLGLAAVLIPIQIFFGHLCGGYVDTYQPSKMAAIEGRWNNEPRSRPSPPSAVGTFNLGDVCERIIALLGRTCSSSFAPLASVHRRQGNSTAAIHSCSRP